MLTAEHVTVRYGECTAVQDLSFQLEEGQWLMLAGPNGAGKSTLINAIAQSLPYSGTIFLRGKNVRSYKPAQLARMVGVLSQHHHVSYAYTVEEIVRLGRYAHSKGFLHGFDDQNKVDQALEVTGMNQMRSKSILELSGGELQRAFLAQVFAQDPQLLLLDEPANHLDLTYQKHVFSLVEEWLRQPGRAVISVVHDLSLARLYGTHTVLMNDACCLAQGPTRQVLSPENLQKAYGMDVQAWMKKLLEQW